MLFYIIIVVVTRIFFLLLTADGVDCHSKDQLLAFYYIFYRGILVLIDGAHSLGQVDLDIPSYDADFYITNCHKWFCNTRGSAIGYVRRQLQHLIRPLVVSWGFRRGFAAEFGWSGKFIVIQLYWFLHGCKSRFLFSSVERNSHFLDCSFHLLSGTQYYSQYISLLSTLNFWKNVGSESIREYCSTTIKQAGERESDNSIRI